MVSFGATPGGERRRADVVDVAVEAPLFVARARGAICVDCGTDCLAMGGLAVGRACCWAGLDEDVVGVCLVVAEHKHKVGFSKPSIFLSHDIIFLSVE